MFPSDELLVHESTRNTWLARLGLDGTLGGFSWGIESEYLDKAPEFDSPLYGYRADDAALWWSVRLGWQLTPAWNIGLRHADSDALAATTLSLRWSPVP